MTCAKVTVTATLVATDGTSYMGTNWCHYPQPLCPRKEGEGYEKCESICGQNSHAEIEALAKAGASARGGTMLVDYTYACQNCINACREAGVERIITQKEIIQCQVRSK